MEGTLKDLGVKIDFSELPFGSLSETSLIAAETLLKDIGYVNAFCFLQCSCLIVQAMLYAIL